MEKIKQLEKCEVCPRKCNVNRLNDEKGFCKLGDEIKIALVSSHDFEEPCISGIGKETESSGTIFFMNFAVGYKVLAGISVLILVMISCLKEGEKRDGF